MKHANVVPILEIAEKVVEHGMFNGILQSIRLEVSLCNVSHILGVVYQDMVPGLVSRRLALRHLLIPCVGALKGRVDIHDDPAIVEEQMMYELPDAEFAASLSHEF
jgi:hypothetical protein